jgi:hypothetical protein
VKWVGGLLTLGALAGLGVYFAVVGLDKASELATVIGLPIALAGLALTGYGMIAARKVQGGEEGKETASNTGETNNEIYGGTFYAPVTQARDVVNGAPRQSQSEDPDTKSAR